MTLLPQRFFDPTLKAIDEALESSENNRPVRGYIGMSGIADSCERKSWYNFRWATKSKFNAETLKRFADGNAGEDMQAERLRMVKGLTLITLDPNTGEQISCVDDTGHFRGHLDGYILGLLQDPKTRYVWEHKQVGEKKQKELIKLKHEFGENNALKHWSEVYYGQACLYMYYTKTNRHYLTCSTPGGRSTISCITEEDSQTALRLIAKAQRIIKSPNPSQRISNNPSWFECKMCNHHAVCFGQAAPDRHCRSCVFSLPIEDGKWHCNKHNQAITLQTQKMGCEYHRYLPSLLVVAEQIDAGDDFFWIEYELPDGTLWRDEGK